MSYTRSTKKHNSQFISRKVDIKGIKQAKFSRLTTYLYSVHCLSVIVCSCVDLHTTVPAILSPGTKRGLTSRLCILQSRYPGEC